MPEPAPDLGRAAWLASLFVGEPDGDGGWWVAPFYRARLAEAACGALLPGSFEEVCALFYPGCSEEDVPGRAWEGMRLGYARYTDGQRRARARQRQEETIA